MIGTIFGKLKVIKDLGIKNRSRNWQCSCECGELVIRSTGELNRGLSKNRIASCRKCSQRSNKSKDLGESSWRMLFNNYVSGALKRDLIFELTYEQFKIICSKDCHYCGSSPSKHNRYIRSDGKLVSKISKFTADRSWISWNGIDRKDNSIGYIVENCLSCCSYCNNMKGTLDYNDFIARCGCIYLTRKLEKC